MSANEANSRQVGGTHYKVGGEEHWDRVARLKLDYFQAQITKYVERWRDKGGVQDLEKARHFLDKYIELEQAKLKHPMRGRSHYKAAPGKSLCGLDCAEDSLSKEREGVNCPSCLNKLQEKTSGHA